jgi:hypothetical protein
VKTNIAGQRPASPIADYSAARQAALQTISAGIASGMAPLAVAQTILRAATTARPQLRYRVGRRANALILLKRLLPEPAFERVRRRVFRAGNPAVLQSQTQLH